MQVPFSGGCACGAIRYECSADPAFSWHCHCRDCLNPTLPKVEKAPNEKQMRALLIPRG